MKTSLLRKISTGLPLLLAVWILNGCATHSVDWNARIGNLTYDQAVLELGPPSKQAKLEDGTVVAEWQTQRGRTQTYYPPTYYGAYRGYAPVYGAPVVSSTPDVFLRLTFNPESRLSAFKKVMQ